MNSKIEGYIRKILEIGCNIQKNDSLIIFSKIDIPEFKEILFKIQTEYKINQIIFIINNQEEIYNFLKTNPQDEQIRKFITKYPQLKNKDRIKVIQIQTEDYDGYEYKLNYEIFNLYSKYRQYDYEINKELYDSIYDSTPTLICYPTDSWAKKIFKTENMKNELWDLIINTIPDNLNEELARLKRIREYLNKTAIRFLYFYTKAGTDFRIGLSKNSKWVSSPFIKENLEYFLNFPSYEIYTTPDYNSSEGKVIITKPSEIYGVNIQTAELQFEKGKCIFCKSDNKKWDKVVLNKTNNLNRIGEIALATDTPISKLNKIFHSIILDENAGCHFALGASCTESITIPKDIIQRRGLKHYNFNESYYHQDLVFGDSSITVEAKLKNKRKILIIENGIWKI